LSTQETFRTHWRAADALADRALACARQAGDDMLIGESLRRKSMAQPNLARAAPIAEEAADYLRRAGNLSDLASLLSTTGFIAIEEEAYERADQLLEQALEAATTARDVNRVAAVRGNQGLAALFQHRLHDAADAFREELTLCRDSRFSTGSLVWEGLTGLAAVAAAAGEPERAAELAGASSTCTETPLNPAETPLYQRLMKRFLDPARAALGNSAWDHAHHAGRDVTPNDAIVTALNDTRVIDALAHPAR
jgi:tetratricopeptide (TPR) repeat protein